MRGTHGERDLLKTLGLFPYDTNTLITSSSLSLLVCHPRESSLELFSPPIQILHLAQRHNQFLMVGGAYMAMNKSARANTTISYTNVFESVLGAESVGDPGSVDETVCVA